MTDKGGVEHKNGDWQVQDFSIRRTFLNYKLPRIIAALLCIPNELLCCALLLRNFRKPISRDRKQTQMVKIEFVVPVTKGSSINQLAWQDNVLGAFANTRMSLKSNLHPFLVAIASEATSRLTMVTQVKLIKYAAPESETLISAS